MIAPPRPGQPYPGRLPPVREQWSKLPLGARVAALAIPLVAVAAVFAVSVPAGASIGVMVVGAGLCTAVFVKNRTDRHNAAIDRGEIRVAPDQHLRPAPGGLPPELAGRLEAVDFGLDIGRVTRFDDGWIVRHSNPRDVAVVLGDDGGWARFDPRRVTDLWAVTEYRAGRGRDD